MPVRRKYFSGTVAARAAAARCGRWLVTANARSCSSGDICTTTEPSACQNASSRSKSSARVFRVGVRMATRPSNRSAWAWRAPVFSLPASGMAAQEAAAAGQVPRPGPPTIACLVLPASVISVPSRAGLGRLADVLDDLAHGRADDHQFGLGDPLGQIDGGMVDGPDPPGDPQADLAAADADDRVGQSPLAQGQADRPADQPHPDDRHVPQVFHRLFRQGLRTQTGYCSRTGEGPGTGGWEQKRGERRQGAEPWAP